MGDFSALVQQKFRCVLIADIEFLCKFCDKKSHMRFFHAKNVLAGLIELKIDFTIVYNKLIGVANKINFRTFLTYLVDINCELI